MPQTQKFSGKTVLIVDDESEIREMVAESLEECGAKVFQATNGTIAIEILKKEKIDAVVSDVRMPGGDGVFLLAESRKLPHPIPPILLMTGYSDLTAEEAIRKGATQLINKPFGLGGIIDFLSEIFKPS